MTTQIYSETGSLYKFNSETGLISRDDVVVSSAECEPVFINFPDSSNPPMFVGIHFKYTNQVMGLSGKISKLINSDTL